MTLSIMPQVTFISCLNSHFGIGRYTDELARNMRAQGQDVQLYRKDPGDPSYVHAYPHRSLRSLRHYIAPYYLQKAIRNQSSDVWHADNIDALSAYHWAGSPKRRGPLVVTIHDIIPLLFPSKKVIERMLYRYHLDNSLKYSDLIMTVSHTSRQDLMEHLGVSADKIRVVYNGLDHHRFQPKQGERAPGPFRIRYIGGLGAVHKNARMLIEVARCLEERKIDFVLEIGSGDAQAAGLVDLAMQYRLRKVQFAGFIPDGQLSSFLQGADLFLYPSLYEGFGFPPLEAMACGTPVVASLTRPHQEILGDAALLAEPQAEVLALAVIRIMEDETLRQQLQQKALSHAERFQWEKAAVETLMAYHH